MRDSLVPDALLRRPMEHGAVYKDHLHEARHEDHLHAHGPLHIQRRHGQGEGRLRSADARADKVNGQYVIKTKARTLDTECFSSDPNVEARAVIRRLRLYPKVRGQCVGAFTECSSDIHLLLRETARSAAMRYWRQVRSSSWGRICGGGCRDLLS